MKTTLQLILIGILMMLFSSCYTEKKAQEQVNKANDKYPAVVGKLARDLYPCTDLLRPDTVIVNGDTVIMIECPEMDGSNYVPRETDTIPIPGTTTTRTVRVPVTLPVQTRYITKWYEDSAKLKLAALELGKAQAVNEKLKGDNDFLSSKLKTRTKYLWWLLALCVGLLVWTFRKLFI